MIDISQTRIELSQEWPLSQFATAVEEGMALQFLMENGVNTVTPATGVTATQIFAGVALSYYTSPTTGVQVDYLTVGASGTAVLSETPLGATATYMSAYLNPVLVNGDYVGGTSLGYTASATPGALQFGVTGTAFKTAAASAGDVVSAIYRYALTVQQAQMLVGDGVAGHTVPSDVTGTIGVIQRGVVFTTNFDTTINWAAPDISNICVQAGGMFTTGTGGAPVNADVYAVPTASSEFLGLYIRG